MKTIVTIRTKIFKKLTTQPSQNEYEFCFCRFGRNKNRDELEALVFDDEYSRFFKNDALKIQITKTESEFERELSKGTNIEPSNLAGKLIVSPEGRWGGFLRHNDETFPFEQLKFVGNSVSKFERNERIDRQTDAFQKELIVGIVGSRDIKRVATDVLKRLGRVQFVEIDGNEEGSASIFWTSSLCKLSRCDYVVSCVGTDAERIALDAACATYLKPRLDVFFSNETNCEIFATSPGEYCGFCLLAYDRSTYPKAKQGFLNPSTIKRRSTLCLPTKTAQFYEQTLSQASVLWRDFLNSPYEKSVRKRVKLDESDGIDVQTFAYAHTSFCPFCQLAGQGDSMLSHIDKTVRNTAVW